MLEEVSKFHFASTSASNFKICHTEYVSTTTGDEYTGIKLETGRAATRVPCIYPTLHYITLQVQMNINF